MQEESNNSIAYVKDKMVCTIFTTTYTAPLGHNESVQKKKILNLSDILDVKITHLSLLIHQHGFANMYLIVV